MDAGLAKIGRWRHGAVGAVIAANVGLGAVGVLGGGTHPERFDSVQIVIAPAGGEGLRITEVLDQAMVRVRRILAKTVASD